jgi:hypothetical protein
MMLHQEFKATVRTVSVIEASSIAMGATLSVAYSTVQI